MSIYSLQLSEYKENLNASIQNKEQFGEVITPLFLIEEMLNLLPPTVFSNPNLKWLDPCAGTGHFSILIYKKLFNSLRTEIKELKKRHYHIISKMLFMVEKNSEHLPRLYSLFGENANIINDDFLQQDITQQYDIIIGNPPFNINGKIKVPTDHHSHKINDGKSIWTCFVKKSIEMLNPGGRLIMITPSIWMKRDHKLFKILTSCGEINKIHCFTNTETNNIFNKQAQTPTCYWLYKNNNKNSNNVSVWDNMSKKYINFPINLSIPLIGSSLILKFLPFVTQFGHIAVVKTSMRPDYKGIDIVDKNDKKHIYPNISTCRLNKLKPELIINYSDKPCVFYGKEKLVLAHKMYGFPYYDALGKYGISNRDNYVITDYSCKDFIKIQHFLSTKLALLVFESTRYRMKYLERYAFEFLPDITKIIDFPEQITDSSIAEYFKFSELERKYIEDYKIKKYKLI